MVPMILNVDPIFFFLYPKPLKNHENVLPYVKNVCLPYYRLKSLNSISRK
jgi:hypothetical protein